MNISLAITYFNKSKFITESLNEYVLNENRINEIVILDDCSTDFDYTYLLELVTKLNNNKIKVYRNDKNLNIPLNKIEVLKYCKNNWIFLLDADNYITKETIDELYKLEEWKENYIYAPTDVKRIGKGSNQLNFKKYNNTVFNKEEFKSIDFFNKKLVCFMNMCNYFLNKNSYLNCMAENLYIIDDLINSIGVRLLTPFDSILLFCIWISQNNNILAVENLIYYHRLYHQSTFFKSNRSKVHKILAKCKSLVQ